MTYVPPSVPPRWLLDFVMSPSEIRDNATHIRFLATTPEQLFGTTHLSLQRAARKSVWRRAVKVKDAFPADLRKRLGSAYITSDERTIWRTDFDYMAIAYMSTFFRTTSRGMTTEQMRKAVRTCEEGVEGLRKSYYVALYHPLDIDLDKKTGDVAMEYYLSLVRGSPADLYQFVRLLDDQPDAVLNTRTIIQDPLV